MPNEHLVVIDMQKKFVSDLPPNERRSVTGVIAALIHDCRELSIPVTAVNLDDEGPIVQPLLSLFQQGEIIEKHFNDAFTSLLFSKRVEPNDELWLVGGYLELCVRATALGALSVGKKVVIYENAVYTQGHALLTKLALTKLLLYPANRFRFTDYESRKTS